MISFECEGRRHHGYKANIKLLGEKIVGRVNEHSQAALVARKKVIKIRSTMKRRAQTTEETPQVIITQAVTGARKVNI